MTLCSQCKSHTSYRCCHNRGKIKCPAFTKVNSKGVQEIVRGHCASCYFKSNVDLPDHMQEQFPAMNGDFTAQMADYVKTEALADMTKSPLKIWKQAVKHFKELAGGADFSGLTRKTVESMVANFRRDHIGGDAVKKVEAEYGGTSLLAFLRHSCTFPDENGMQRMMCFGTPELFMFLLYPLVSLKLPIENKSIHCFC